MWSSYDLFLYLPPSSNVDRCTICMLGKHCLDITSMQYIRSEKIPGYTLIFLTTLYCTSKYLSRNVVQTLIVFAYVSKSEITFPSAVSWHMIILHWIEEKNEITIYRKYPTLCPIILIPSVCTINEIISRQKIDMFIIFSLTEENEIGRDCTDWRQIRDSTGRFLTNKWHYNTKY